MAGAQKKVIVRFRSGEMQAGYLPANNFTAGDQLEMIDLQGTVKSLQMKDIHLIAYVTDFNLSNSVEPEQLGRRAFLAKPRGTGLWLRVTFLDGTALEGLAAADLRFAAELATDHGVFLTPPDPKSNAHRVYIPCTAMATLEILAVIGMGAEARPKPSARLAPRTQPGLFEDT